MIFTLPGRPRGRASGEESHYGSVVREARLITSVRQAAAASGVSPPVVRRWLTLGLIPGPPWTTQQLHEVRDLTDPQGRGRARAQQRLPVEMRQQLLDAIYGGHPFRMVLRDLGLTSNQVWGLAKTDREWAEKLDTP